MSDGVVVYWRDEDKAKSREAWTAPRDAHYCWTEYGPYLGVFDLDRPEPVVGGQIHYPIVVSLDKDSLSAAIVRERFPHGAASEVIA